MRGEGSEHESDMPDLKLARLPDRTPVKISITVSPDLNKALHAYAELYWETYGEAESVADLIPYILESFLDGDRSFAKARRDRGLDGSASETDPAPLVVRRRRRNAVEPSSTASTEATGLNVLRVTKANSAFS